MDATETNKLYPAYRVIVTGSRDWPSTALIHDALMSAWLHTESSQDMVVLIGDCPTGADSIAKGWVRPRIGQGVNFLEYRTHWKEWGLSAGPRRNARMVEDGADLCLAFLMPCDKTNCPRPKPHYSHGTMNCLGLAREAGIETKEFYL